MNKGLKEDFLIFSKGWHDGLPCPIEEGKPGGGLTVDLYALACVFLSFPLSLFLTRFVFYFFYFNDLADNCSTKPQLSLVNRMSLNKILRSEVYINEADGQLQAAHLIPISCAFQAPKCVIKSNDPRLHIISVAYERFVVPEGIPIPEGTPFTQPLFVATPSIGGASSQPILQEEEEEENSEGIVTLSKSSNEFEVFNQLPSSEDISANIDSQQQVDVITSDEMDI